MKTFVVLFAIVAVAWCAEEVSIEDLNIESLLADEPRRKAAFDCLMDKGPCGELQKLRDTVPAMIETKCANCTPKQKEKFEQINKLLFAKYPKQYQDLLTKYSSKTE